MKLAHLSRSEFFLTGKFEVESLVAIGMKIHSFENAEHTIGFIRSRVTRTFYIIFIVVACYLSRNLSEFENLEACHNFLSYEISDVTACNVIYETIAKKFSRKSRYDTGSVQSYIIQSHNVLFFI